MDRLLTVACPEGSYSQWIQLDTDPRRGLHPLVGYWLDTGIFLSKCCNNLGYCVDTDGYWNHLLMDTAHASGWVQHLDTGYRTPLMVMV